MNKFLILLTVICLVSCSSDKDWICINGDCNNGYGKRVWKDGGYEKGTWKNGKLNGSGEMFFGNTSDFAGDTYKGEFKEDRYDGKGTYYHKSAGATYTGDFKEGRAEGKGIIKFSHTSEFPDQYYEGDWKNNKKEGFGTLFFGSAEKIKNDKYIGEFKNDKMDGKGKFYFGASGSIFEGSWENNLRQGDGVHTDKNGKVTNVHCESGDCVPIENNN